MSYVLAIAGFQFAGSRGDTSPDSSWFWVSGRKWSEEFPDAHRFGTAHSARSMRDHLAATTGLRGIAVVRDYGTTDEVRS